MKLQFKFKVAIFVYTIFYGIILFCLLYLHFKYPGYFVHYSFLVLNYNNWIVYALVTLLYLMAIVEAYATILVYTFLKKKVKSLHFHKWQATGIPYEMKCTICGRKNHGIYKSN